MYEHPWHNLTLQLGPNLAKFNQAIKRDPQFLAFTHTGHISTPITFAIKSIGSDDAILFSFNQTFGEARAGKYADALFSLAALPNQWQEIFKQNPKPPYQSIWGLYGQNIRQDGVEVIGDQLAFANYAHIWRTMLDVLHDVHCGPNDVASQPQLAEDFLMGRYVFVTTKAWGNGLPHGQAAGDQVTCGLAYLRVRRGQSWLDYSLDICLATSDTCDVRPQTIPVCTKLYPSPGISAEKSPVSACCKVSVVHTRANSTYMQQMRT
jgi:hypothetical protein